MGGCVGDLNADSFRPEHFTQNHLVDDRAEVRRLRDFFERWLIAEAGWSAGGVGEELLGEAAGEVGGALGVDLLPGGEVGEGVAFGGGAGGVDFSALIALAVGAAPEADGVVIF